MSSHTRHDQGETATQKIGSTPGLSFTKHERLTSKWLKKAQKKECDLLWAEFPQGKKHFKIDKHEGGCLMLEPEKPEHVDSVPDVGGTGALLGLSLLVFAFIKRKDSK